uniref:LTA synthase family protein n=1 Tax=Acetatifactor sp. TaxID=1872090 RepID=UPI004056F6A3
MKEKVSNIVRSMVGELRNNYLSTSQKRCVAYCLFVSYFLYLFACYFPFVMEYYVARPEENMLVYLFDKFIAAGPYSYYEMVIVFFLTIIFWSLTLRLDVSIGIVSLLGLVLSYASHLKYVNRLEMLHYTDLKLTEAAGMAVNYLTFDFDKYLFYPLLYVIFIVFLCRLLRKLVKKDIINYQKKKILLFARLIFFVMAIAVLICYHNDFMNTEYSRNPQERYLYFLKQSDHHVLYQFLQDTQINTTPEEIRRSYIALTEELEAEDESTVFENEELPTIIVIMNESWWNLDHIPSDKVSYSVDPMKALWDLDERCDVGSVSVNIYGGGTISSESEFLTGLNTKYFSSTSDIYNTLEDREFPSIVRYFNSLGYNTTSIHPYYGDFYNRESLYPTVGFKKSIFEETMLYDEIFDKYISDESLVNQIIYEYENAHESPNFIFAISIASHGDNLEYDYELADDFSYKVDVTLGDGVYMSDDDYSSFVHYVNGIYEANLAYTQLIDYFEQKDSPVMIVMFGDHCPNLTTNTLASLGFDMENNEKWTYTSTEMDVMRKIYMTPVIAWNNFSDKPFVVDGENINALCDKIIDCAGLPETRMTLINKYLRKLIKTDTRSHMIAPDGKPVSTLSAEQAQSIETFLMIQYDILQGDLICNDIWEPLE